MFIKINDSCIINTDHIVWVDTLQNGLLVKMSDGTEHVTDGNKLTLAMELINHNNERSA